MSLVVQKYGGTSVGSIERIAAVADHIAATVKNGLEVVVTVSAMGEQTDELLAMARQLNHEPPRREVDMLLTAGERISMALLSIALHRLKIASRSFTGSQSGILTDDNHGNAKILRLSGERIRQCLADGHVAIVAGFQGVSPVTKEITTLGRGGSDLTAIAIAGALGAERCELYKDVDGVFSADPRLVPSARKLTSLSWSAMTDLAWSGASVLHARGAHLAKKYQLPLEIRSSFNLDRIGTVINGARSMEGAIIHAISQTKKLTLLRYRIGNPSVMVEVIPKGLSWLWERGETAILSHQSAANDGAEITQTVTDERATDYLQFMKTEVERRNSTFSVVEQATNLAAVTIVGEGFWQNPDLVAKAYTCFDKAPRMLEVKNNLITACVTEDVVNATLIKLHDALIGK